MKREFIYNLLDRLIKIISIFIITVYMARKLGISEFGEYASLIAIKNIMLVVVSLGFDSLLIKYFSENRPKARLALLRLFVKKKYLIVLISFPLILFFYSQSVVTINVLLLCLLLFPIFTLESYFKAISKTKFVLISSSMAYLVVFVTIVFFEAFSFDNSNLFYILLIDTFVMAVCLSFYFIRNKTETKLFLTHKHIELTSGYDATSWKPIFPVALSASCSILMTRLDVLLVQNFLSPEETSSIAAAGRLNALFIFPLLALQQVLISHISKLQYISFKKLVSIQLIGILIYSFFIFLFYYLFGALTMRLVFGDEFSGLGDLLYLYAFSNIFFSLPIVMAFWYYHFNLQSHVALKNLCGLLLYIGLALYLLPIHGIHGVIYSYIIAGIYISIIGDCFNVKSRKLTKTYLRVGV